MWSTIYDVTPELITELFLTIIQPTEGFFLVFPKFFLLIKSKI